MSGLLSNGSHALERAREDFKLYMTKLLESNKALESFHRQSQKMSAAKSPAWSTPPRPSSASPHLLRGRAHIEAKGREDYNACSPGYFRDEQNWPRAGKVADLPDMPPPNFSWEDLETPPPMKHRRGRGRSMDASMERGNRHGRGPNSSLIGETLAPASDVRWPGHEHEELYRDRWKQVWSKRLTHGPIHSDYQTNFRWPVPLDPTNGADATAPGHGHTPVSSAPAPAPVQAEAQAQAQGLDFGPEIPPDVQAFQGAGSSVAGKGETNSWLSEGDERGVMDSD
ncbi:unnamed protein product, partial [Discosporangium mesarthrocarpum]